MRLGGIVDMSTIDWPGNVSLVVFFAGCNFRCPYCHNSSLIPLDSGQEINIDYLRSRIEVGRSLLDSVVLTGGEPLLQPEGVREAAELVKDLRLKVMLDTNGSRPEIMEDLLVDMLIDRVALDIKAPLNPQSYSVFRGSLDSEI
ncbi:MAG: anaerobic ribonucleoside-triphosphate reductase activating protein, partial [Candidatus Bathyarchaeota archaeon]